MWQHQRLVSRGLESSSQAIRRLIRQLAVECQLLKKPNSRSRPEGALQTTENAKVFAWTKLAGFAGFKYLYKRRVSTCNGLV